MTNERKAAFLSVFRARTAVDQDEFEAFALLVLYGNETKALEVLVEHDEWDEGVSELSEAVAEAEARLS